MEENCPNRSSSENPIEEDLDKGTISQTENSIPQPETQTNQEQPMSVDDNNSENTTTSPPPSSTDPPPIDSDRIEENSRADTGTPLLDDTDCDHDETSRNQSETPISEGNEQQDDDNNDSPMLDENATSQQSMASTTDDKTEQNNEEQRDKITEDEETDKAENENIGNTSGRENETFEQIDINEEEKEKSSHTEETDALGEDRTQIIPENKDDSNSPMDVDQNTSLNQSCSEDQADKTTEDAEMESTDADASKEKDAEMTVGEDQDVSKENSSTEKDHESTKSSLQCEEQVEEGAVIEAEPNESEDICLLPDEEKELTGAEKERAIQARQQAEKEAEEQAKNGTRVSTPTDETNAEEDNEQEQIEIDGDSAAPDSEISESLLQEVKELEIKELLSNITEQKCYKCGETKPGKYKLLINGNFNYLCDIQCVNEFRLANEEQQYTLNVCRRVIISSIFDTTQPCEQCKETKSCRFYFKNTENGNFMYLCAGSCLNEFIGKNIEKYLVRRKKYLVEELLKETEAQCVYCKEKKNCKYIFKQDDDSLYICEDACYFLLSKEEPERFRIKKRTVRVRESAQLLKQVDNEPKIVARSESEAQAAKLDRNASFIRRCAQCFSTVEGNDRLLQWETIDFCNEICLGKYQNTIGSRCQSCQNAVPVPSLGKYCVRFGFEVRQFCCSNCLDCFKKELKVCSLCQKDISKDKEGFLAPIGDKGQFKDFCSQDCLKQYEDLHNSKKKIQIAQCAVCNNEKPVRVEIILDDRMHYFCSNPCFSAFKFVNNIVPDQCAMCTKYFERKSASSFTIYQDKVPKVFCCKICMNLFIILNRKIVPCQWCKVKKYNFDMIQKQCGPQVLMLCSLNCLTLYGVSLNAISMRQEKCDQCARQVTPQYHLTMSDATIRNFCTYQCVMLFQSQFGRTPLTLEGVAEKEADNRGSSPFPTSLPKRIKPNVAAGTVQLPQTKSVKDPSVMPIIANVESLAAQMMDTSGNNTSVKRTLRKYKGRGKSAGADMSDSFNIESTMRSTMTINSSTQTKPPARRTVGTVTLEKDLNEPKTKIITVPPFPRTSSNKTTMCKPNTINKAVICRPNAVNMQCQTDKDMYEKVIVPLPVPIYVPQPMYMYSAPFPVPVPIPLPIPVPIFIPTTRNSAAGIMKEIKKIQDKMPSNPLEADLLMMAEMVAGEKKKEDSDSDDDDGAPMNNDDDFVTDNVEPSNSFGEDMLQMALKMATEYEEPAVDLESAMATNTITPSVHSHMQEDDINSHQMIMIDGQRQIIRGRKRVLPMDGSIQQTSPRNNRLQTTPPQKKRREMQQQQQQQQHHHIMNQQIIEPVKQEPVEKPDANMVLKYTFGVNAWKQWVMTKNAEIEKSSIKRRPFKSELLQMTADELNYSLCLFVKEVRKPNGSEYAPDTIYYLVLGIQQYLYENGRIDNIFTDSYYERFTDCLDEVAKKFSILYNDSQYIVTRVEEEHLWECKQLGAHSPHVLLSTLMFFNTKHFNLTTVEEHMQLSFSHIMKHWKRSTPGTKTGSRNVLLRFYPPQIASDANPRKKKVYEQQENEENPLRCPVKLYEFYLSKCPESVKTRNDVFYLQPERSCVPDSPVWYSTQPLSREALSKMLHRVKMVKEINIALLTS